MHFDGHRAPRREQISHIMAQATAPAFMLGAVAGLISILSLRLNGIFDRIRNVKALAPENISRAQRDSDVSHLKRRAALLHRSIRLGARSGHLHRIPSHAGVRDGVRPTAS